MRNRRHQTGRLIFFTLTLTALLLLALSGALPERTSTSTAQAYEEEAQMEPSGSDAETDGASAEFVTATNRMMVAPANDLCTEAVPLTLNMPVDGTTGEAANDYRTFNGSCYAGIGQTPMIPNGRDVVYSFTAPTTNTYSIRVTGYTNTSDLVLYATSSCPTTGMPPYAVPGCLLAANRRPNSTAEEIFCLPLEARQQIYIYVDEESDNNSAGDDFTIEVTQCTTSGLTTSYPPSFYPVCGVENVIDAAGSLRYHTISNNHNVNDEKRVYALLDGVAANNDDFDMRLVGRDYESDPMLTLEYDDNNNISPFGEASPNLAGTPLLRDTSLRVNHRSNMAAGPYRLYAVIQEEADVRTESEPNGTPAQADCHPRNYFSGFLAGPAPSTDVDHFAFEAQAGELLFLSLDGDPTRNNTPINPRLQLLDADGNVLVSVNNSASTSNNTVAPGEINVSPFSPAEGIVYRARTTGTYFAKVLIGTTSTGSTGTGNYLLSVTRNCRTGGGGFPGALEFSSASYTSAEAGAVRIISVNRPGGSDGTATVAYATSDGTAVAGEDYVATSGTLTWTHGDSAAKTFQVPLINDAPDEDNETINLTLSNPSGR